MGEKVRSHHTGTRGALNGAFGAAAIIAFLFTLAVPAAADVPWPQPAPGQDSGAYQDYCRSEALPDDLLPSSADFWKYTGRAALSPYHLFLSLYQPDLYAGELGGVMGACIDEAWKITTGRPDVLVAGLDCGVRWHDIGAVRDLAGKIYLNPGESPPPLGGDRWDADGDGVFNVEDYAGDPRVTDLNGNGLLDPQDLIWSLSDGEDDDGNGYVDDIAGWDFFEDDNDPWDEVEAGPVVGWAAWAVGEADNGSGTAGACPNAMFLPVRVSDSLLVDASRFAQGLVYAVDCGAWVAQAPLRCRDNSSFARAAVEYASSRGTTVVASTGEEGGAWQNFPGAYEGVVRAGALRKYQDIGSFTLDQFPPSYLYLAGNTNYGPGAMVSVPADGERGEAVARLAGVAALVVSAAQDRVKRGEVWPYPGLEVPLSAGEVKQILAMTADDVDFSSASRQVNMGHLGTVAGPSLRDPSGPGWDPCFGYGRVNARRAVQAVSEGDIPPEAEIRSPRWGDVADPGDVSLDVRGKVAAVRANYYFYTVEWGPGTNPSEKEWKTVTISSNLYEPLEGVLATLDLGPVYGTLQEREERGDNGGSEERYAFTIRVRVRDNRGNWGEDRKTIRCIHDRDAYPGTPFRLGAGLSCPPRPADLDNDGAEELLVADGNGWLHAYRSDFTELEGWPVHSTPLPLHTGGKGYGSGLLPRLVFASFTGPPSAGDLDRDGRLEVVACDSMGRVHAWDAKGSPLPGFPVCSNPLFSVPDRSDWWTEGVLPAEWHASRFTPDRVHRLDRGNALAREFVGGPVLANLDGSGDGSLEILAAGRDQHVYAWHHDGRPVAGWPVKLADPGKVARLDPLTHWVEYVEAREVVQGRGAAAEPTTADLDGDGDLEVVCVSGEVYGESEPGVSPWSFLAAVTFPMLKPLLDRAAPQSMRPGYTRMYVLHHRGMDTGGDAGARKDGVPAYAYLEGWPVRLPTLASGFLGGFLDRTCGRPAVCDVDGDGRQEIGVSVTAGPAFILDGRGRSLQGEDACGLPLSLESGGTGGEAGSRDVPVLCSSGGGCFARLGSGGYLYLAPTLGMARVVDLVFPARQTGGSDQLSAWKAVDGSFAPAYPRRLEGSLPGMTPGAADVDGDGIPEAVVAGWGAVRAFDEWGREPAGWPKVTGGMTVGAPTSMDIDGDGREEVFTGTLEGWLLGWRTGPAAKDSGWWPEYGHDPWNSGWEGNDARRPARVSDLAAEVVQGEGGKTILRLTWTAPGDDGRSGRAMCYEVRWLDRPIDGENWKEAAPLAGSKPLPGEPGHLEEMTAEELPFDLSGGREYHVALVTRDEAGNLSPVSNSASLVAGDR